MVRTQISVNPTPTPNPTLGATLTFKDNAAAIDPQPDISAAEGEGEDERCSNIRDNALHETPPDLLIGEEVVVERRRAKYVAISRLTDDFMGTAGVLTAFEGELEDGQAMIALLSQYADTPQRGSARAEDQYSDLGFDWSVDPIGPRMDRSGKGAPSGGGRTAAHMGDESKPGKSTFQDPVGSG